MPADEKLLWGQGGIPRALADNEQQQQPHAAEAENADARAAAAPGKTCELEGSSDPPGDEIVIDYEKIRAADPTHRTRLKHLTEEAHEKYLSDRAGREHYALLSYVSDAYGDCRHFLDIGTRYVTSSLAAGSNLRSPVWTLDLPNSAERRRAFRGKTEAEWQAEARGAGVDVEFHNKNLLAVPDEEFRRYLGTWFVFLDTFHEPDTRPFERELFRRVRGAGFKGILGLDDIHLNGEMEKWWKEVQEGAEAGGYRTFDVTAVGHRTGTGLVDFSGKVAIRPSPA